MKDLNFDKVKLMDISIHHDDKYSKSDPTWYLSATYLCENEAGIYEVVLPQINLPFWNNRLPNISISESIHYLNRYVDFDFIDITLHPVNTSKEYVVCKEVETKVHEMTLQEIEKKLGYKIKVISEK